MEDSTEEVAVEGKRSLRIRTKQAAGKDSKEPESSSERQVKLKFWCFMAKYDLKISRSRINNLKEIVSEVWTICWIVESFTI